MMNFFANPNIATQVLVYDSVQVDYPDF